MKLRLPSRTRMVLAAHIVDLERQPGERWMVSAATDNGGCLIASTHRLLVRESRHLVLAREWVQWANASWDRSAATLTATDIEGQSWSWHLAHEGFLPQAVHERLRASIVLSETVSLGPGRGGQVSIRSQPGRPRLPAQITAAPPVGVDPWLDRALQDAARRLAEQIGRDTVDF